MPQVKQAVKKAAKKKPLTKAVKKPIKKSKDLTKVLQKALDKPVKIKATKKQLEKLKAEFDKPFEGQWVAGNLAFNSDTGEVVPDVSIDLSQAPEKPYSHSFIQNIAACTAKAYFRATHAPKRKAFALERGSLCHKAIEDYLTKGIDPLEALPELWRQFIEDNIKEMSLSDQDKAAKEFKATRVMLKEFLVEAKDFQSRIKPEDVEVTFTIPVEFDTDKGKIARNVTGKIDLVLWDSKRESYTVLDFKTSAKAPSKDGLDRDTQFAIYQLAATRLYGKPPKSMEYYLLRGELIEGAKKATNIDERDINNYSYSFSVPVKTDEEIQTMLNSYYLSNILKFELGIFGKDGLNNSSSMGPCGMCEYIETCNATKSFPLPRGVRVG